MEFFSSLPDDVVCHILSFLTTKEAALTSILSKRWRNLFAFVPNLAIDDSVFLHPEEGKREKDEILQSFIDFVNRVLTLQGNSPIKKFSLKCKTEVDGDYVERWICNVLQRGVLDLDLFIHAEDFYCYLPQEIASETLVKLKLRSECDLYWWAGGEGTFLPKLRTLVIESPSICGDMLEMIQISLPVLEELEIAIEKWMDSEVTVSNASLRKLTISANGCDVWFNPKSVSFDTPSLVYFEYSDYVAKNYPKINLPNLVKARIDLLLSEYHFKNLRLEDDDFNVFHWFRNMWKLISGLRNVQELFLSPNTLEVLSLCNDTMPVFNNLKSLVIESDMDRGWQAMPVLLRNCPYLETLVLEGLLHYETDKCGDACNCISREDKGRSLISCPVKKLQIKRFEGKDRESEMIKHFLESFKCLKEMEIYSEENSLLLFKDPKTFELLVKLFKFYDLVYTCHVKFLVCSPLYQNWTAL